MEPIKYKGYLISERKEYQVTEIKETFSGLIVFKCKSLNEAIKHINKRTDKGKGLKYSVK